MKASSAAMARGEIPATVNSWTPATAALEEVRIVPLYEFTCQQGHLLEAYVAGYEEARETIYTCVRCGSIMRYLAGCHGQGALWAEEGRPRTIYNLGDKPVTITSRAEHKRAMKAAGVTEAGNRMGEKGCWI